jgi:hypothetical protein
MPPKNLMIPGNGATEPTDLIPDADAYDDDSDDTLAGLPIVAANKLARDAFNALFYAYPGVGKTTIEGMFAAYPPACPVLIVDAEGGASVLAHLDNVYVVQVQTWAQTEKLLSTLEMQAKKGTLKYKTICWDNVTEFHSMLINHIVGKGDIQIQHHGRILGELMRFARRNRDLSRFHGVNTVLVAWQETKENKTTGLTRQTVALTAKLSERLPGVPNNVGYITILNDPPNYTRKLSFAASPLNDAKLRRAPGDGASSIPLEIFYGLHQNPIADILRTIYEGVPFPSDKYQRPKKGRKTGAMVDPDTDSASDADESESAETVVST